MGDDAEGAVPAIAALLDSDDGEIACRAAETLGQIGPAARSAIERLISCTGDPNQRMETTALHALRRIGREKRLRPPELFAALHADGDVAMSLILWCPEPPLPSVGSGTAQLTPAGTPVLHVHRVGYGVTDADMGHLKRLTHLAVLNLSDNPVGDVGLASLANLKLLKRLYLADTHITSAGLRHLAGLANLEGLDLTHCAINDQGLAQLGSLRSLKVLHLDLTRVTDLGLPHLKGLTELRELGLDFTSVTDNGLVCLCRFTSLEKLNLTDTRVTDAGLAHLKSLLNLRFLLLKGTQVSQRGVDELQKALPAAKIEVMPGIDPPSWPPDREYEVLGLKQTVSVQP